MQIFKDSASIDWNSFHPANLLHKPIQEFLILNILFFFSLPASNLSIPFTGDSSSMTRNPNPFFFEYPLRPRFDARANVVETSPIPNPDRKKPGVKSWKALTMGRCSYSNCASCLRRNQLFPAVHCHFSRLPAAQFTSRTKEKEQEDSFSRAYRPPPRFLDGREGTRGGGGNTRARFHTGCPWLQGPWRSRCPCIVVVVVVVSCQRYRACAFLHLTEQPPRMGSTTPLRMMTTRIDSWTDYSIRSSAPLAFLGHRIPLFLLAVVRAPILFLFLLLLLQKSWPW